jgi:hypothetical protein
VLQFGGASGSGYLSQAEVQAGMQALKREGEFKDGVFRPPRRRRGQAQRRRLPGDLGARQRAAHGLSQAALSAADLHGSRQLRLGAGRRFSRREREAARRVHRNGAAKPAFVRLDAGARFTARGKGVYVVTRGAGTVDGQPLRALTTIYVDAGETVTISRAGGNRASCISACPISPACTCLRTSRSTSKPRSRRQPFTPGLSSSAQADDPVIAGVG